MTKLEEYRKKRQEEFVKLCGTSTMDGGFEGSYDRFDVENAVRFISETVEGIIEIFREIVGEDEKMSDPKFDSLHYSRPFYHINQERQRIREQLPSK